MNKILKFFYNRYYKFRRPRMVHFWDWGVPKKARVITAPDGSYQMQIEGEEYLYPGYPRGHVLMGALATLKYQVKNLIFNDSWAKLEAGQATDAILKELRTIIMPEVAGEILRQRINMLPVERTVRAVREIHRAMTKAATGLSDWQLFYVLRDGLTFFLQEDDAYRFRFQWISRYLKGFRFWRQPRIEDFEKLFKLLENAEIVPDMKGRTVLIQRVFSLFLEDAAVKEFVKRFLKELKWSEVYLSKADKYYFRGKYFKVDHQNYDY